MLLPLRILALVFFLMLLGIEVGLAQSSTYTVRAGDTLYSIARMHNVTVADLQRWNGLADTRIQVGWHLRVEQEAHRPLETEAAPPVTHPPQEGEPVKEEVPVDTTALDFAGYTVQPGETLYSIAARFGLPVDTLSAWNDAPTAPLEPGRTLRLPPAFATVPYRVRPGDTLFRIATEHRVTVEAVRLANDLKGDGIGVGQVLQIPSREAMPGRASLPAVTATGPVLVYPDTFSGRLTAGGVAYDPARFTVSHASLPLGTLVLLTDPATGRATFAEVNDRGPLDPRYLMDVSAAVQQQLRLKAGASVEVRVVD